MASLYQEYQGNQETEEKLCKWTDVDKLRAYEKDLLNSAGKTVGEMLDSWENPVFAAPEKVSHNVQSYQTVGHGEFNDIKLMLFLMLMVLLIAG